MRTARNGQKSTLNGAITPVVAIEPKTHTKKFVLEVTDLDNADIGEQLSLADMITPEAPAKSTRSRKSTPKASQSTVSKARNKTAVEASLTVPIAASAVPPNQDVSQEIVAQFQQLRSDITQLQTRLAQLNQPENPTAASTPAPSSGASPQEPTQETGTTGLRLPDWREPELRSHYTLREAQAAYAALEQQQQQRTYKTAAPEELQAAHQTAQRLRQPLSPQRQQPPSTTQRPSQRRTVRRSVRRSGRRFHWDAHRFASNVYHLILRLIPIPRDPGTKLVDAAAWVLASIGLRLVLKLLIQLLPILTWPTHLLLAIPALVAAYLAFCVEHSRSDVIYRLLLMSIGLFFGSRL
jgi:hypothetical protein